MAAPIWKSVPCKISELCLDKVLVCGQSFRWREHVAGVWTGVIGNAVWQLKQTNSELFYKVYRDTSSVKEDLKVPDLMEKETESKTKISASTRIVKRKMEAIDFVQDGKTDVGTFKKETVKGSNYNDVIVGTVKQEKVECYNPSGGTVSTSIQENNEDFAILRGYFQLDINLEDLYKTWSEADKNFENTSKQFYGIRMLRQDPVECLFSFICSSNNNISRITTMVEKLAEHYGKKIEVSGCVIDRDFYAFPKVEALAAEGVEENLRQLGFGYRAKYIQQSAKLIQEKGGEQWLHTLRDIEYREARKCLLQLHGVGAKVADCVALMCLDHPGSIPVDTHVWQIAARDYMPKLRFAKSLTDKLYDEIGDFFRNLWGPYAGWAHSVLFVSDLRQFKEGKKKHQDKKALKRKSDDIGGDKQE